MLLTSHATLGAAIAVQINNPLAIPLALLSHFVLDRIPHRQASLFPYKPTTKAWIVLILDLFFALIFTNYIAQLHPGREWFIWSCAIISCLPDLGNVASINSKLLQNRYFKKFYQWHVGVQKETDKVWGLIPQLVITILAIFVSV